MRPSKTVNLLLCEMRGIVTKNRGLTAVKIFPRWGRDVGGVLPTDFQKL